MRASRYEEYATGSDGVPFVLYTDILRTATHYSSAANWHEGIEIQYCLRGEGYVLLDGKRTGFCQGDTVAVNSGVIHYTGSDSEIVYSCLILDTDFCREAGIDVQKLCFSECFRDKDMAVYFERASLFYTEKSDPYRIAKLRMLALEILVALCERHASPTPLCEGSDRTHRQVKDAISYIRTHYAEQISLESVARAVFVDKSVLARRFRRATGRTVVDYLNAYRCREAQTLLLRGASVSEAAGLCGFGNMSFFSKTFKKYIGKLPSSYKQK